MVEEQRAKVDESMTQLIDELDKAHLRRLQGNVFRCAAKCCEDKDASPSSVQRCIENCSSVLNSAQKYVQSEINHLQDRLQRCIMSCNDTVRDKMGVGPSELEINRYTKEFEGCSGKCVETHLNLIDPTLKKIKEFLKQKDFQN